MPLTNRKYTYDKLGEITTNGIEVAIFPQIRDAIADRMKEIYGNDIDLSTASADGQYINMEALILTNVYRLISNLYDNINPFIASGKYLDVLCSLTNVKRKQSSKSTAQVYIKNVSNSTQTPERITLIDRNNNEWVWVNPKDLSNNPTVTINSGDITLQTFTCDIYGKVEANASPLINALPTNYNPATDIDWNAENFLDTNGDIYKTIDYGTYKVFQPLDANIGNDEETDASLRNRRYQYLGSNSVTTQAGLESALFDLEEIDDVYILNNNTGTNLAYTNPLCKDGVAIDNHNVYIVLRYKEGITADEQNIANIIYSKLTPGVITEEYGKAGDQASGGVAVEKSVTVISGVTTNINWKKCTPVNPPIIITFFITTNFPEGNELYEGSIIKQLKNYLNSIKINETLIGSSILTTMLGADLKYQGMNTFYPLECSIDGETTNDAPFTYYKYNTFVFEYGVNQGKLYIGYVDDSSTQFATPSTISISTTTLSIPRTSMSVGGSTVYADYYKIFVNDVETKVISGTDATITYDLSNLNLAAGSYSITVKAGKINYKDSNSSNQVTYVES